LTRIPSASVTIFNHVKSSRDALRMPTTSEPTDEALLVQAAAGDAQAFMVLYDRFAPRIFGLLIRIMRNRADAEDALQVVSLEIWRRAPMYNPALGSAASWILMIARARAIDALRASGRALQEIDAGSMATDAHTSSDPPSSARSRQLTAAMQALPVEQRAAIEFAFYRGLTRDQAATALGVPVGTVKTRIRSGVRALAESLSRAESRRA
jgi:RNA polymerase sigma-70 factor, ECF subfamily